MNKIVKKIYNQVIEDYRKDRNVLGIILFGSAIKNKFDQYSDIDIYVLLNKKGKFSRVNFIQNGIRVDIIIESLNEAKAFLKDDKNAVKRISSQMLSDGIIIFQRNSKIKQIQESAKHNLKLKTKYNEGEILMHKYSIDDFWGEVRRDIKNNDHVAFGIDSNLLVNNIIELFFKLEGDFLRQPNEMKEAINKLDSKFLKLVESFYRSESFKDKEKILLALVNYIYEKSAGPLPDAWSLKN